MDTRKYIFLVYLLTSFVSIYATTYFISNSLGNDSNSGLSLQNPIKTISRLNAFNFYPGDSILFKSQDTFHGMFWLKGSGDLTHPIVVDTYGGIEKAIINGDGYQSSILLYSQPSSISLLILSSRICKRPCFVFGVIII